MRSWANNPRYQRARQKIMTLRPEHRAILSTVSADPEFAAENMRKGIQSMILNTQNTNRERGFKSLQKERKRRNILSDKRVAMADRDLSYGKGQGKKAFAIGLGNLGLSSYGAHKQKGRDDKILEELETMNDRYDNAGLNRGIRDMDRLGTLGIHRFKNYRGDIPDYLDMEQ
ncbi:MAG: hypothetical protein JRG81_00080 [Deltaproteobacteria bacterium]|nr:hypothetical protein [Deltaproteobacteria bacterium]MBW2363474.1 hypothetical protein [Deltaproteobacteria bacterium]